MNKGEKKGRFVRPALVASGLGDAPYIVEFWIATVLGASLVLAVQRRDGADVSRDRNAAVDRHRLAVV